MTNKFTKDQYLQMKSMSLQDKIDMSCEKIEQWYNHWSGMVYVAFSGGKDSTVLLDLVRNKAFIPDAKNIPAVFNDTGLEFPEIRNFVKTINNVVWLKPKLSFKQVIEHYGYPIISKEQSQFFHEYQRTKSEKLRNLRLNGNRWGLGKIRKKYLYLTNAPFKISHKCCAALKKYPASTYEKDTKRYGILGSTAEESSLRLTTYLKYGCNTFEANRPISTPMVFWTEENVWEYIKKFNLLYSKIYDMGYQRTGCMFCLFGIQRKNSDTNILKMNKTHPQIYKYCINELGIGKVLDFMNINYE